MNWLDLTVIGLAAFAAIKGFTRGLIVELASLVGLLAGVWVAMHFSNQVVQAIGLDTKNKVIAFALTCIIVLLVLHFLARLLTAVVDMAQLSLPNKIGGALLGLIRALFILSVTLNLLLGYSNGSMPSATARKEAMLYAPVAAFAPWLIPELESTQWIKGAMNRVQREAEGVLRAP